MRLTSAPLLALALMFLSVGSIAAEAPDLSGSWKLDEANSETMREKARERALEQAARPRARQRWERAEERERQSLESAPFSRLTVTQSEDSVEIRYRDGQTRAIFTDGRELEPDPARGIQGAMASWDGSSLVVENRTARGKRIERWERSDDGKRLFVTTEVQGGEPFGTLSFVRIYDLEPPTPPAATAGDAGTQGEEPGEPAAEDASDDGGD